MRYFIVDAFTNQPFRGNPAAVVILEQAIAAERMQAIAAEFNLAETAFLLAQDKNRWSLRWFTPKVEMDLCGHATLASAFTLWQRLDYPKETQYFSTLSGELTATPRGDKIELNFPVVAYQEIDIDNAVSSALKLDPLQTAVTEQDLLLELSNADGVKNYQPNFAAIESLPYRGLMLTANSQRDVTDVDFVSRFFAPKVNIPEDPVTGAMHCTLAAYWANKLNKTEFRARQLSARGGELEITLQGERVLLVGNAVCTMQGEIVI